MSQTGSTAAALPNGRLPYDLTIPHKIVIVGSIVVTLGIFVGIIFGANSEFPGTGKTVSKICADLWIFGFPAFYILEETVFAKNYSPGQLAKFIDDQKMARIIVLFCYGGIAILTGGTAEPITKASIIGP